MEFIVANFNRNVGIFLSEFPSVQKFPSSEHENVEYVLYVLVVFIKSLLCKIVKAYY